jgi:D-threonate/D-erythronate kinase
MLAVIADDITGAAEIAGIGLRYGMRVMLTTSANIPPPAKQLWVVALNTRSMDKQHAVSVIYETVGQLRDAGVTDIFKKTDSLLRGHVIDELEAQLNAEGKKKVILCPANPEGGRQIIDGLYLINGIPISQTNFATDPEYPIYTSDVGAMLGKDLDNKGIYPIMNAECRNDLLQAAGKKKKHIILAGSAAFFEAYLEYLNFIPQKDREPIPEIKNALYVFGSALEKSHESVERAAKAGLSVTYISPFWLDGSELDSNLGNCVLRLISDIRNEGRGILAIGKPVLGDKKSGERLRYCIAAVVNKVFETTDIQTLIIEGGATTFAIIDLLNFNQFIPTDEISPGVVRMVAEETKKLFLIIKPGSYNYPEVVWPY